MPKNSLVAYADMRMFRELVFNPIFYAIRYRHHKVLVIVQNLLADTRSRGHAEHLVFVSQVSLQDTLAIDVCPRSLKYGRAGLRAAFTYYLYTCLVHTRV